ncbi:hypothetical protein [Gracilibacillus phocaeensis]|uniref:hypothetical protein n=1 Tax=Gracilibacillus phocaeensis TaxID=2042304 RepID=UPI00102F8C56|nr:hypothetical protein [Gracilibacillus phocaeensis]
MFGYLRRDIIFHKINGFKDTPLPILSVKLMLMAGVVVFAFLSIGLEEVWLGYGMIGMGLLMMTLGVEKKLVDQEHITLTFSIVVAIVFFAISSYIFSNH